MSKEKRIVIVPIYAVIGIEVEVESQIVDEDQFVEAAKELINSTEVLEVSKLQVNGSKINWEKATIIHP
jgi:hypothetical protein